MPPENYLPPDKPDPLDEMVSLNFRVTERERRAFKSFCAANGMTQTDGFRAGFDLLKEKKADG